jgi:methionyl-tRNA formyltransferase
MRVVISTRVVPVALGLGGALRELGHEPVGLLTVRDSSGRYGDFDIGELVNAVPDDIDVVLPSRRSAIAPLLEALRPDLVVCVGFPWKIPADALAVPRLGWLNGHPSLLPRHRGPVPVAWAIRRGDPEIGVTFHLMDAELDTGPIYAQRAMPVGEYVDPDSFYPRLGPVMIEALKEAVAKLEAGEAGTPQTADDAEYETFFGDDDARLDLARPRDELHRLIWAWRYTIPRGELHGVLTELDGETVRVLASSLTEVDGARRVECADGPLWLVQTEPA